MSHLQLGPFSGLTPRQTLGFLVGSIIVALRVTNGDSSASDFVIFISYLVQLYEPLNMLSSIYRSINTALVDTEKLLKLLNEPVSIKDKPNAPDLIVTNGEIEFGPLISWYPIDT